MQRRVVRWQAGIVAGLLLAGCAATPSGPPSGASARCAGHGIRIDAQFERGSLARCQVESATAAQLVFSPEPGGGGNDSAWYAFRVAARRPATLDLELRFDGGSFRYWPQWSTDGHQWQRVPANDVYAEPDGRGARLRIAAGRSPLFVAAQPLETIEQALAASRPALQRAGFVEREIGRSHDGRPLLAFELLPAAADTLVVLLARQHPPETTGAVAFDAFVQRLLADTAEANALRQRTAWLVVPVANPDGLARGHWRGNASGADLNRDWQSPQQPETRAITARIESLAATHTPIALIDFHSTRRNVLYAPPLGAASQPLGDRFVEALTQRLRDQALPVVRSHRADAATAKSWALERFGVAGITYEVGDATPPQAVAALASTAADAFTFAALRWLDGAAPSRAEAAPAAIPVDASPAFVHEAWPGENVPVWYLRPPGAGPDARVLFVMHGVLRDAHRYLEEWRALAEQRGIIVVVPEFPATTFPGAASYILGRTRSPAGDDNPRDRWTYSALEGIFDAVVARERLTTPRYLLYGHSAGAQFVHRFALLGVGRRLERAVAVNAGWYTFADPNVLWPYGFAGAPFEPEMLDAALRAPLTVIAGELDNDPLYYNLRRTPEAMEQGPHRLARAIRFYEAGRSAARARRAQFNWACATAPGLAHENAHAARYAVSVLLGSTVLPAGGDCRALEPIAR